jgi:hypothetical protein
MQIVAWRQGRRFGSRGLESQRGAPRAAESFPASGVPSFAERLVLSFETPDAVSFIARVVARDGVSAARAITVGGGISSPLHGAP